MPMHDVIQNTPEWLALRRGRVTASEVWKVMAKRKKGDGELAVTADYREALVCERLTHITVGCYVSQALEWGIEQQPFAQAAYEVRLDRDVKDAGFAVHDKIDGFGASPDGLVSPDGLLEIKCLTTGNHIDILRSGKIPEEYEWQMLAEMACTGRQWCDFVSFDPRIPHHLQLFVKRFFWDEARIAEMEKAVEAFLASVDEIMAGLEAIREKELVTA